MQAADILAQIWQDVSLPTGCLGAVNFIGTDAVLPSSFNVTAAAAACAGQNAVVRACLA